MPDRYCDHGAYAACQITGTISSGGTVLTLNSVVSGQFGLFAELDHPSIAAGAYIASLASGTLGAAGSTYNIAHPVVSPIVTAAITAGAISLRYGHPMPTPATWGVPQEGDGTLSTPSTASAICVIDLTGASAAAGNSISVLGATLSCVASGASTNQFNAGSGTTLIDNLVTAINRTSNTVTLTAQATGWGTPLIQNAVFARRNGNNLEIMTRAGSATYNGKTVLLSGFTSVPGGLTSFTFSGGVSGCWGWATNRQTMWPSGITFGNYGPHGQNFTVLAGLVLPGEVLHFRSNKYIRLFNGGAYLSLPALGTVNEYVTYRVDDSTIWSDGANPVLTYDSNPTNNFFPLSFNSSGFIRWEGKTYASGQKSLVIRKNGVFGGNDSLTMSYSQPYILAHALLELYGTSGVFNPTTANGGSSSASRGSRWISVDFQKATISQGVFLTAGDSGSCRLRAENCRFILTAAGSQVIGVFNFQGATAQTFGVELDGCKFVGFPTGSRLHPQTTSWGPWFVLLRNCDLGGITSLGPDLFGAGLALGDSTFPRGIYVVNQNGNRAFIANTPHGMTAWEPARDYPTLAARLYDGSTPWSIRMIPCSIAGSVGLSGFVESPRFGKINTLGEAVRTAKVELLVDTTLTFSRKDVALVMEYEETDGTVRVIESYSQAGAALDTSTAPWSKTTFSDTGVINYNKRSINLTTPTAVKAGSEMSFFVRLYGQGSNSTQGIFFDPEVVVS